jgi:hypothetical protein
MRVYGIDFAPEPSRETPISCAMCRISDDELVLDGLCEFESIDSFGNLLGMDGPWVAGVDFPFGLPREFLAPLRWPADWERCVSEVGILQRSEFRALSDALHGAASAARRVFRRRTDESAAAVDPSSATGAMFHAGAPVLLSSQASVLPVREADRSRVVVEASPELVAQALVGVSAYKSAGRSAGSAPSDVPRAMREALLDALCGEALYAGYGLCVAGVTGLEDELLDDDHGDRIDALMCAVQAAWAWRRRDRGFGFPVDVDRVEGCIADPAVHTAN